MRQTFPAFILGQTLLALLSWIAASIYICTTTGDFATFLQNTAGIDTISNGRTDLRLTDGNCRDFRSDVWRYLTYQWTHIGLTHILLNSFLTLVFGIPLEGLHGHLRLLLMYNVGVFGGACCYWVGDAHKNVVGMSGGCYSLIGMHFSNLIMNWYQMKFRWLTVTFLFILTTTDICCYFFAVGPENASHAAHIGGFIAGGLISTIFGANIIIRCWDRCVQVVSVGIALGLGSWCIIHLIINDVPRNIFESYGWCYLGQVYDVARFGNIWQCVQCASTDCIDGFKSQGPQVEVLKVSIRECKSFFYEGQIYDA